MAKSIADVVRDLNFYEMHKVFLDNKYYEVLFPFLLVFAVLFAVLCKIKIFQYKKGEKAGEPIKSIVFVVSMVTAFYGVSFQLSDGYNVGNLLMMMFPNISALTIGILGLYIVASILGKNFFKDLFRKDTSAYLYMAIGVIGLGTVIYYVGIAMGFWSPNPIGQESQWNFILAVAFLIMGVVFIFVGLVPLAVVLFMVLGVFIYNYGQSGSILEYFIDPVVFVIFIVVALLSWMSSDKEKKAKLDMSIAKSEKTLREDFAGVDKDYEARVRDIIDESLKNMKKQRSKLK